MARTDRGLAPHKLAATKPASGSSRLVRSSAPHSIRQQPTAESRQLSTCDVQASMYTINWANFNKFPVSPPPSNTLPIDFGAPAVFGIGADLCVRARVRVRGASPLSLPDNLSVITEVELF